MFKLVRDLIGSIVRIIQLSLKWSLWGFSVICNISGGEHGVLSIIYQGLALLVGISYLIGTLLVIYFGGWPKEVFLLGFIIYMLVGLGLSELLKRRLSSKFEHSITELDCQVLFWPLALLRELRKMGFSGIKAIRALILAATSLFALALIIGIFLAFLSKSFVLALFLVIVYWISKQFADGVEEDLYT